jgi:hypothetical protein
LDEGFVKTLEDIDSKMALVNLYLMEAIVCYMFDDSNYAGKNLSYLNKYESELQGYFTMGFIQTWLATFHYECFLATGHRFHKKLARKSHRRVQYWSSTGTKMLHGPHQFLDAMSMLCAWNAAPCEDLVERFQHAASTCASSHCLILEALAYERLAKFLYKHDLQECHVYQNQAMMLYRKWGAFAKARHVENFFQDYL